nr:PREDICTED: meiotic recombination protein REC114 isoform X5 [Lepisosteus oculatus]
MAAPPEPGGLNAAPRWPLRRYSRFLPKATAGDSTSSWKVFNSSESAGQLELTIVQSGHFLITQGHGLLEGFSLLNASNFLKVIQKTDILLFRFKIKSESRMFRVQFEGSSKEEALEQCQSAVIALQQYLFVESTPVQGEASSADTHSAERKISEVLPGGVQTYPSTRVPAPHSAHGAAGALPAALPPRSELPSLR